MRSWICVQIDVEDDADDVDKYFAEEMRRELGEDLDEDEDGDDDFSGEDEDAADADLDGARAFTSGFRIVFGLI